MNFIASLSKQEWPLRIRAGGVLLDVTAIPKASRSEIAGFRNGALLVKVTAPPDKGKANVAIIALLAKAIGIPKSALELVSGETVRNKVFRLVSHAEAVQSWLRGLHQE
jgi:uncharacterized protein